MYAIRSYYENSETEEIEEKKETDLWALFEDIKSLMKKGMTTEELKLMESYMKDIFKKLDNDSLSQNVV